MSRRNGKALTRNVSRRNGKALTRRDLKFHPLVAGARSLARRVGLWAVRQITLESLRSLWRNRASTVFAVAIIALSLATVGAFVLVAQNLSSVLERATSLEVTVFLDDDTSAADVDAIQRRIGDEPGVVAARYVTPAQALETFSRINPELAAIPDALGENPFPPSVELTLTRAARVPTELAALAVRLEALPGVDHVGEELEMAQRASAVARVARLVATALGAVLLLAALFTVSTVVRLTIFARRSEVELLRLVGATDAYVRLTFVAEGVVQGLAGSTLGALLLWLAYHAVTVALAPLGVGILGTLTSEFLSLRATAILVIAGGLLGALGSLVPLRTIER